MRSIPGMTVLCPADDVEAKAAVKAAYEHEGPVYLRFGRLALPVFHDEATFKFEIGKGNSSPRAAMWPSSPPAWK